MTGMDRDFDFNLNANGNIAPCRFVVLDISEDEAATQATANALTIGISADGTHNAPGTPADDGLRAVAGETVPVFGTGRKTLLELGGSVIRGDRLIADATGRGVVSATTGTVIQNIGARALQSGTIGLKVLVLVEQYPFRPAIV